MKHYSCKHYNCKCDRIGCLAEFIWGDVVDYDVKHFSSEPVFVQCPQCGFPARVLGGHFKSDKPHDLVHEYNKFIHNTSMHNSVKDILLDNRNEFTGESYSPLDKYRRPRAPVDHILLDWMDTCNQNQLISDLSAELGMKHNGSTHAIIIEILKELKRLRKICLTTDIRVPYGYELRVSNPTNLPDLCYDCKCPMGSLHSPGCDREECFKCRAQKISCRCNHE